MTVGSFEFSDVVDEAVERSGGQTATAADVQKIRRGLRLLTERWIAQGYNTWRVKESQLVTAGISTSVSLPHDLDDVLQMNSIRGQRSETTMTRISATQYAQLTQKTTKGQPSQYYLDRKEKPKAFLYPIGVQDEQTVITVWYVARPEDFDRYGDTTDDVPGRWLDALVTGLALDLARKRPPYNENLIARLKGEANEAEDLAQRADRGRHPYTYRTSYSR